MTSTHLPGHQLDCAYVQWLTNQGNAITAPPECSCARHLTQVSRIDWDSLPTVVIDRPVVLEGRGGRIAVIPEVGPPLVEVPCPDCGTTIRARMADAEHPAPEAYVVARRSPAGMAVGPQYDTAEEATAALGLNPSWSVYAMVPLT